MSRNINERIPEHTIFPHVLCLWWIDGARRVLLDPVRQARLADLCGYGIRIL